MRGRRTGPDEHAEYAAFLTRLTNSTSLLQREQATDLLTKRAPYPGQRYRHGWIPVGAGGEALHDALNLSQHDRDYEQFHASHRIQGRGEIHTTVALSNTEDGPMVHVATPGRPFEFAADGKWGRTAEPPGDYQPNRSGYQGAVLEQKDAQKVADHLRDLVMIAESGTAKPTKKRTEHAKTLAALDHFLTEGNDVAASDKIVVGSNEDTLPMTYGQLRKILAQLAPPDPDAARTTRKVTHATGWDDNGDVHMALDTSGPEPVIHLTGRERGQGPWVPEEDEDTAQLSLDGARELADMLDRYAKAKVAEE